MPPIRQNIITILWSVIRKVFIRETGHAEEGTQERSFRKRALKMEKEPVCTWWQKGIQTETKRKAHGMNRFAWSKDNEYRVYNGKYALQERQMPENVLIKNWPPDAAGGSAFWWNNDKYIMKGVTVYTTVLEGNTGGFFSVSPEKWSPLQWQEGTGGSFSNMTPEDVKAPYDMKYRQRKTKKAELSEQTHRQRKVGHWCCNVERLRRMM